MVTKRTQNKQPAPAMAAAEPANPGNVLTLLQATAKGTKRTGLLSGASTLENAKIAEKINLMQGAKQFLAEAVDLYQAGAEKEDEAAEVANKAAVRLYQARANEIISPEEVSNILGEQFGFKPKKDGSVSKTPEGRGEALRKRIVRMVSAFEFSRDETKGGTFYEGLDPNEVAAIVDAVDAGEMPIFTAYDKLAALKPKADRVPAAFNPKAIAAIAEELSKEGAVKMLIESIPLRMAYASLFDILLVVDEVATPDAVAAE